MQQFHLCLIVAFSCFWRNFICSWCFSSCYLLHSLSYFWFSWWPPSNTRVFPKCYTEFFISFLLISWFDISEKCSRHLDACSSHPVRNSPFLSLTGRCLLHLLFANTAVILYNSLFSLFYAASSAFFVYPSSVIPSHTLHNFFIRIRVVHFLFSRFANIYSSCNFLPSGNFIPCFLRSPFFFFVFFLYPFTSSNVFKSPL